MLNGELYNTQSNKFYFRILETYLFRTN